MKETRTGEEKNKNQSTHVPSIYVCTFWNVLSEAHVRFTYSYISLELKEEYEMGPSEHLAD